MNDLRTALCEQAVHCDALGSPFMGQLMRLLAERLTPETSPLVARLFDWPGDIGPRAASLPLRLAGGLHALVLRGVAPGLAALYPPNTAHDNQLWNAVLDALQSHDDWLSTWIQSPPQTNEIRRASVLRAAAHWITARFDLPLEVLELGASAGLNLHWDAYGLRLGERVFGPLDAPIMLAPDWTGPSPPDVIPQLAAARGVDLAPPDIDHPDDRLRLMAYLWPDQTDRLRRTRTALALPRPNVAKDDAVTWLGAQLTAPHPGRARVIWHTIAWQYFPKAAQIRGAAMIADAGASATKDAPLIWFGMEPDDGAKGAALTLRHWPDGATLDAGRACFHGQWVDWQLPDPR